MPRTNENTREAPDRNGAQHSGGSAKAAIVLFMWRLLLILHSLSLSLNISDVAPLQVCDTSAIIMKMVAIRSNAKGLGVVLSNTVCVCSELSVEPRKSTTAEMPPVWSNIAPHLRDNDLTELVPIIHYFLAPVSTLLNKYRHFSSS